MRERAGGNLAHRKNFPFPEAIASKREGRKQSLPYFAVAAASGEQNG